MLICKVKNNVSSIITHYRKHYNSSFGIEIWKLNTFENYIRLLLIYIIHTYLCVYVLELLNKKFIVKCLNF